MRLTITVLAVMALVASGCAGPEVSDGNDVSGGTEQVANDEAPQETSSAPVPDETDSREPSEGANESDSNEPIHEEEAPEQEDTDGTALMTSTTVKKSSPSPSTTTPAPEGTVSPSVANSDFVGKAKEDLADRLGVAADAIEVVSVQEVDWPDASAGCPQPDMVYAQVITNGSRIILSHSGVSYSYHSATGGDPFYCENPSDAVPDSET